MCKRSELQESKGKSNGYPPKRAIRIRNISDARRLLSRLISQLQREEIEDRHAKTLCYICISYVNITRDTEFEVRLEQLEKTAAEYERYQK